jgi:hypothetical protein
MVIEQNLTKKKRVVVTLLKVCHNHANKYLPNQREIVMLNAAALSMAEGCIEKMQREIVMLNAAALSMPEGCIEKMQREIVMLNAAALSMAEGCIEKMQREIVMLNAAALSMAEGCIEKMQREAPTPPRYQTHQSQTTARSAGCCPMDCGGWWLE